MKKENWYTSPNTITMHIPARNEFVFHLRKGSCKIGKYQLNELVQVNAKCSTIVILNWLEFSQTETHKFIIYSSFIFFFERCEYISRITLSTYVDGISSSK